MCRCSDRKTCPLETRTSALSFSTRITARLAATTARGWCDALSTSARPTARVYGPPGTEPGARCLQPRNPRVVIRAEAADGRARKDAWNSEQGAARGVRQRVRSCRLRSFERTHVRRRREQDAAARANVSLTYS